jgi:hypothetical protein
MACCAVLLFARTPPSRSRRDRGNTLGVKQAIGFCLAVRFVAVTEARAVVQDKECNVHETAGK